MYLLIKGPIKTLVIVLNRDLISSLLCMQKVIERGHVTAIKNSRRALCIS